MRYVTTMIEFEKMREGFRLEWMGLSRRLTAASTPDVPERIIEMRKNFLLQMKEKTEKETQLWVSEFQSNLAQFEKDLRSQLEANRPGAIDVRVGDGADAVDGFDLALDNMIVERITGESGSIGNVAPGLHKVTVSAQIQKRSYTSSQIVNVAAAGVSRLEMPLGVKGTPATPETRETTAKTPKTSEKAMETIDLSVATDAPVAAGAGAHAAVKDSLSSVHGELNR